MLCPPAYVAASRSEPASSTNGHAGIRAPMSYNTRAVPTQVRMATSGVCVQMSEALSLVRSMGSLLQTSATDAHHTAPAEMFKWGGQTAAAADLLRSCSSLKIAAVHGTCPNSWWI